MLGTISRIHFQLLVDPLHHVHAKRKGVKLVTQTQFGLPNLVYYATRVTFYATHMTRIKNSG